MFELRIFKKPEYLSLDCLTFAGSGTPLAVNLPHFEDLRKINCKNISLQNAYPNPVKENLDFLSSEDQDLVVEHFKNAVYLLVTLHELFGHGCGKMFRVNKEGVYNYPHDDVFCPFTVDTCNFTTCF